VATSESKSASPPDRFVGGPEALAWTAALVTAGLALAWLAYGSRDADSRLYAQIAARMSTEPFGRWIAPEWPTGWYLTGPFVEHPVGVFLIPALLGRLGYPALQGAYLANALYQVLSILLVRRLAGIFAPGLGARTVVWAVQLIPIAFTYRARANHEPALLLLLLCALHAVERSRVRARWGIALAGALVCLALVKGLVGLLGFPICALWLWARGGEATSRRGVVGAWACLGAGIGAVWLAAEGYDALYEVATGQSFLALYLGRQVAPAMATQSEALVVQKAYNLVWYGGRLLWFPCPWSLAVILGCWAWIRSKVAREVASEDARARYRGLFFAVAVASLYAVLFSLSDRRADRYIYAAYFALCAAGCVGAVREWPAFARLAERLDRWRAWAPAVLWLALLALHVAAGRILHLPTVKVWAPDS
jgi:4-amino-4-deoxy-L-arabinose transferase-like glycosyltransferase